MLELGNKVTMAGVVYKDVFKAMGIEHVSVDWNGRNGALKLDLREPLHLGQFDMVTNFGTSEHVDRQEPVWRNMVEATRKVLICSTPYPGDWKWHGKYYPTKAFYHMLADFNGLDIERFDTWGSPPRRLIQARFRRKAGVPFVMPDKDLLYVNKV